MYPQSELALLAARKIELRIRNGINRTACAQATARLARPLAYLDQALAAWRRLSPLILSLGLPLGLILQRSFAPRLKKLTTVLRWGPLALSTLRILTAPPLVRR
jgi:hypothetical protein